MTTIPETGWLSTETMSAHVLVVGGRAGALLTIYRSSDAVDMPVIEFRAVIKANDLASGVPPAPPRSNAVPVSVNNVPAADLSLIAHLQNLGDVSVANGEWSSNRHSTDPIEGFQISASKDGEPVEMEYQGVMGSDWLTPWFKSGLYCGSRGLQLPMLGFRVRLSAEAAKRYSLQYWGVFGGNDVIGPLTDENLCQSDQKTLTSMRVVVVSREISREALVQNGGAAPEAAKPVRSIKPNAERTKVMTGRRARSPKLDTTASS